jgi:ferritin-like metal-binding protein YciE
MPATTLKEQLIKYLTDAHSIERQALAQMKAAPRIAGDPEIAEIFSQHLRETETHDRLVSGRLEAYSANPSVVKDVAGTLTGYGFALFARLNPDTPGKLVVHALSYEHMEEAAYALLRRVAERTGDVDTVQVAETIEGQERAMAERVAACFDRAADASLAEQQPEDLTQQLVKYLADAHAIEAQALQLLDKGRKLAGSPELSQAYEEHRVETEEHERRVTERLEAHGASPSRVKDATLALGALNWGGFFAAQPDTPAKLAGFAYAFEHLEVGAYEMLSRIAQHAGDSGTERVAQEILAQEQAAATRIWGLFDEALEVTLRERGLAASPG